MNAKRRGRPPRNQKSRNDSVENSPGLDSDDDGSSSRGTLDAFIPPPKNFEGFNNPFRDLGIGPFAPKPTQLKVVLSPERSKGPGPGLLMVHDPNKPLEVGLVMESIMILCFSFIFLQNGTNGDAETNGNHGDSPGKQPGKFLSDLKCSLNSYFGAETRIAKGERFNVAAR